MNTDPTKQRHGDFFGGEDAWQEGGTLNLDPAEQPLFEISRVGIVVVVTFAADVEALPDSAIEQMKADLCRQLTDLLADGGDVILDVGSVHYMGSVFLMVLRRVWMVAKKLGAEMVLCRASARFRELLHLTATDTIWTCAGDVQEALADLETTVELACPAPGCQAWVGAPCSAILRQHSEHACARCGARFILRPCGMADLQTGGVALAVLSLPTYEGECLELRAATDYPGPVCPPHWVRVVGRLDLFAAERLDRLGEVLPRPRRVILDVSSATDLTPAGIDCLSRFGASPGDRVVLLVPEERSGRWSGLPAGFPAFRQRTEAVQALGESAAQDSKPLTVRVRQVKGPAQAPGTSP